ncbi:MAG: hypothetical protein H3Z52_16440, partial [archaeon]|nr:hypothetical protein [archaeon]
ALLSPFRIRLKRLSSRKRSGDPKTEKELEERDEAELKLGLGDVIAKADSYIVNGDRPIEVLKRLNTLGRSLKMFILLLCYPLFESD